MGVPVRPDLAKQNHIQKKKRKEKGEGNSTKFASHCISQHDALDKKCSQS